MSRGLLRVLFFLLLCAAAPLHAQQQASWIMLRPEAVQHGPLVNTERASRPALPTDRAIPKDLLQKIEATGARVRYASRWLQAVSVQADARTLEKLASLKGVRAIVPVGKVYGAAAKPVAGAENALAFDSAFYGPNWKAIRQLGIPSAHQLGFTGSGVKIAILDTGFEPGHEALQTRSLIAQRDFINGDNVVSNQPGDPTDPAFDQERHGTWVWSLLGGYLPGKLVGPAFDASFILAKVDVVQLGDADVSADEDRWVAGVEWADSAGARIINSSLTFRQFVDRGVYPYEALNGDFTISARIADQAAQRQILLVAAIGNLGPEQGTLSTPADADSVIAVGAVDEAGAPAAFRTGGASARGPTADGRLKPEVAALGVGLTAARSTQAAGYDDELDGTSFSTPLVAGAAAMFMQAWPNLSITALRNALMQSGTRAGQPDNIVGFGVPDVSSAILFPEGLDAIGITSANGANQLTTIQPTFTWSAPLINTAMRPVRYRLEISRDANFTSIVYTDTISEAFSLTVKRPLQPAPQLFWRVVATSTVAPDVRRTTRAAPSFSVPDWVRLTTFNTVPTSTTDSVRPVFAWEALAAPPPSGPLVFEVQIFNATSGVLIQSIPGITTNHAQALEALAANVTYRWRLIARSPTQVADTVEGGNFLVTNSAQPPVTLLYQNFPNSFPRPDLGLNTTRIWFDVNTTTKVELAVYDLRGRLVRNLIPASRTCGAVVLDPGQYGRAGAEPNPCILTEWDGTDENLNPVPRGVYVLRLRAAGTVQTKRMLYLPN